MGASTTNPSTTAYTDRTAAIATSVRGSERSACIVLTLFARARRGVNLFAYIASRLLAYPVCASVPTTGRRRGRTVALVTPNERTTVSQTTLRRIAAAAVAGGVAWIVFAVLAVASAGGQEDGKVDL